MMNIPHGRVWNKALRRQLRTAKQIKAAGKHRVYGPGHGRFRAIRRVISTQGRDLLGNWKRNDMPKIMPADARAILRGRR